MTCSCIFQFGWESINSPGLFRRSVPLYFFPVRRVFPSAFGSKNPHHPRIASIPYPRVMLGFSSPFPNADSSRLEFTMVLLLLFVWPTSLIGTFFLGSNPQIAFLLFQYFDTTRISAALFLPIPLLRPVSCASFFHLASLPNPDPLFPIHSFASALFHPCRHS